MITVKEYHLEHNDLKGLKIVFLTDLHHSEINSIEKIKRIVKKTNGLNPDIILLGGDYVDEPDYIDPLFEELKHLKANIGIYGVLGNHDYVSSSKIKRKIEESFQLLDDNYYDISYQNSSLKLAGVGDIWNEQPLLEMNFLEEEEVILISHNPDFAESLTTQNIDYMLSGHTHGGQLTFFGLFAPFIPSEYGQKYRTGFIKNENIDVIVSNGLGSMFLPMRFFALPQIVLIEYI